MFYQPSKNRLYSIKVKTFPNMVQLTRKYHHNIGPYNTKEYGNQYKMETELSSGSQELSEQAVNFLRTGTSDTEQGSSFKQLTPLLPSSENQNLQNQSLSSQKRNDQKVRI